MSLIFYGYEDQFEPKQVLSQSGETIKQVIQRLLAAEQFADEVGFQIDVNSVIIVLKKDITRLVNLNEQVQRLMHQNSESQLELLLICPNEEGGVLIEYIVNKRFCYFENYVNKNDQLSTFIHALCKRINFQPKYELKVNGKKDSLKAPFLKKTIKQIIGTSNIQKITVEINEVNEVQNKQSESNLKKQQKGSQAIQNRSAKKAIRDKSRPKSKKQQIVSNKKQVSVIEYGKIKQKMQAPGPKVQQNVKVNRAQQKKNDRIIEKQQQKEQIPAIKIPEEPLKISQSKKEPNLEIQKNDRYLFAIKFQTNTGIRSQTYQVQKSKTMKDILPEVLKMLADAGFDWDPNWNHPSDYQDKLAILYGRQQYKKYQAKFLSVLSSTSNKVTHDFQFQRLFQGG